MRPFLALLLTLTALTAIPALESGDPAPPLTGATAIKGTIPTAWDGSTWTVVEFWATWCPPCRESIPHLTALQRQHGDKLVIVGLSDEDEETVRPFVTEQGANMDYIVGLAGEQLHQRYMAGIGGIPHAFLVDPQGIVAWHGHPMRIDDILEQALAGTLNRERVQRILALEAALDESLQGRDAAAIGGHARALVEAEPFHARGLQILLAVAQHQNDAAAYRQVLTDLDIDAMPAALATELAHSLAQQEPLWRHLDIALRLGNHAVEAAPDDPQAAQVRASLLAHLGDLAGAIAEQTRATKLKPEDETIAGVLAYYQQAQAIARSRSDDPRAPADAASSPSDPADRP